MKIWVLEPKSDENRIQAIHDALVDVMKGAELCTISHKGLVLPDYVITSVSRSHQGGQGGKASFTVELQHVQQVSTLSLSLAGGLPVPSILDAIPALDIGAKGTGAVAKKVEEHAFLTASDIGVNIHGGAI